MLFNKFKTKQQSFIELQAQSLNMPITYLTNLYQGKSCPKYGTDEPLHIRKVRGGQYVVFNISERYRGEKISEGRKKTKANHNAADDAIDENDKVQN